MIPHGYLIHHGIIGQKWGVRRYQNSDGSYTSAGKARRLSGSLSENLYKKAQEKEPIISNDIYSAVSGTSGKMYGLEHRLKTKESLNRKIKTDSEEKGISIEESASGIKDAVRYTVLSKDNDFVKNYNTVKSNLEKKGYSEARCKNYFDLYNKGEVKHKSVQSVFKTPDGYLFEVQFQTPASQKAKNDKLPLYEEARKAGIKPERRAQLEYQMELLAEKVPNPKGIYSIKTH